MKEEPGNVVRFRPKPKQPKPKPAPPRKAQRPGGAEPAVNWSRAPRFLAVTVVVLAVLWLLGQLSGWVSGVGM